LSYVKNTEWSITQELTEVKGNVEGLGDTVPKIPFWEKSGKALPQTLREGPQGIAA
jgi:hypothetical protein